MGGYRTSTFWLTMAWLSLMRVAFATTMGTKMVVCAECGTTNTVHVITSTSSFGSMDLDSRPPSPARDNLKYQIQVCNKCRYSAIDISRPLTSNESKKYLLSIKQKKHSTLSDNYHIAAELIQRETGNMLEAAFYDIRAAWVEDDCKNAHDRAKMFRRNAIAKLEQYMNSGGRMSPSMMMVLSDLYRRTGRFPDAETMAERVYIISGKKGFLADCAKLEIENCQRFNSNRVHTGQSKGAN